jgi:hypothetical protein
MTRRGKTPPQPIEARSQPDPSLALDWPADTSYVTLVEAAGLVGYTPDAIREAIRSGRLVAFIPGGRTPLNTGRGKGYRITRANLEAFYFGTERP